MHIADIDADPDVAQLLADMRNYRTFVAALKWIGWALIPSKTQVENARHLKHLCEWDYGCTREIDHATFQAAMSRAGYKGTPTGGHDYTYYVCLSPNYRRTHKDKKLLYYLPWGWSWLANALKPGPPVI